MKGRIAHRLEEAILLLLIILQVFDFLELLPGDIDYAKKILSWSALGYLVYKVNLSKIMFGHEEKASHVNILILISYFLLITKNITGYSMVAEDAYLFSPLLEFFRENAFLIEIVSFYIGGTVLLLTALYLSVKWDIESPSLMHIIHEEGLPPRKPFKIMVRFISIYLVLVSFFIVVFNLMMEWLAMAVDAMLVMTAILFYLFIVVRHYRKLSPETLIYKIGEVGENFYENFIELFQDKKKIALGVSGMLVLHLLTDMANFIVPYIVSRKDTLYFGSLAPSSHQSLAQLIVADFATTNSLIGKVAVTWTYAFNVIAVVALLLLPAYVWYKLYKRQGFTISPSALIIFFASITVLLMNPVMGMSPIPDAGEGGLVGVDFTTHSITGNTILTLVTSILVGIVVYALGKAHIIGRKLVLLAVIIMDFSFSLYIYYFFKSTSEYYINIIVLLLKNSYFFIGTYMLIFFVITMLFYMLGFFLFIAESIKEYRQIRV